MILERFIADSSTPAKVDLLSIDGGGIRGIIPAVALGKLEATTGRPARETFSFAAGTSTGAIIAAAIAAGIPATSIAELYVERARETSAALPPSRSPFCERKS